MTAHVTFADVTRERVLGPRLLRARLHHNSRSFPGSYVSLREAIDALAGTYAVGAEPPARAYAADGPHTVIKTGSLEPWRASVDELSPRAGQVLPYAAVDQGLRNGDILIAKDGPVGQVGMLRWHTRSPHPMVSSGILRVQLPRGAWFYLGILKYGTFTTEIDLLTPTGSTYRHAGREVLLSSMVPRLGVKLETEARVAQLAALIVTSEWLIRRRFRSTLKLIDACLGVEPGPWEPRRAITTYADKRAAGRYDARFHASRASALQRAIDKRSSRSLADLVDAGDVKRRREQNLQFTAIGHATKHDDRSAGSYRLIEPNFIGPAFSVLRHRWLSCPRQLKTIEDGSVLMSAEGSIGLVTVFRAEPEMRAVSNIHAISMRWDSDDSPVRNSLLAANLVYLREKCLLDAYSVGGQGGSLAHRYHDLVPILDHDPQLAGACHTAIAAGPAPATVDQLKAASADQLAQLRRGARGQSIARLDELRRNAEDAVREVIAAEFPDL